MKKIVLIYAQGRSGTSVLTRLIASSDRFYSGRAESPILYLLSQLISLKKSFNNDRFYLKRHQFLLFERFILIVFRFQTIIGSFYEAFKSKKLNQLPKNLNFKKSILVTNLPVLPVNNIELNHLKDKFEIELIGIVRNPLEVLSSRIAFPGFKYSTSDHVKDILDRHSVFKKNCSKFITYDQLKSKKIESILCDSFNIENIDMEVLDIKIHPTKKKQLEAKDIYRLVDDNELSFQFNEYIKWYENLQTILL